MYALEAWTFEHDVALINTIYPMGDPNRETGMAAHLWGGWRWRTQEGKEYRTDGEGYGLWVWRDGDQDWHQLEGTCQFSLPRDRAKALRILKREFKLAQL